MKERMIVLMVVFVTGLLTSQASSDLKNLAEANNAFYFPLKIYQSLSLPQEENLFFSPASILTSLEMLLKGAGGNTAEEIKEVLYPPTAELTNETLHQKFKDFIELVGKSSNDHILEIANALVKDNSFPISPDYVEILETLYKTTVTDVDFRDKEDALNEINGWVSEETHGIIPNLLDDVDDDTVVVLLNAVYFKGKWEHEFDPNLTEVDVFYAYGRDPIMVPMMKDDKYFFYNEFEEDNFKALRLPYKGGHLNMLILLPNEKDGWKELEESLTIQKLTEIISNLDDKRKLAVSIPKFKFEDQMKLVKNLEEMGMEDAFNAERANFTGISLYNTPGLYVTDVVHKAVIEVNEEGSKVAGSSGVATGLRSGRSISQIEFKADHPFLFFIYEHLTADIVFMARITKP